MELLGTDNYDQAKRDHLGWAAEFLGNGGGWDDKWTRSVAVGSKEFVDKVRSKLGLLAKGRDVTETDGGYQLRESTEPYLPHFEAEKGDIGPENTYLWNITD
jgi:putative transposase